MIRGTTPTFTFVIRDVLKEIISEIEVTFFQQSSEKTIKKLYSKEEIAFVPNKDNEVECRLSQEDTLDFNTGLVQIQMRVLTSNGDVCASDIARVRVEKTLSEQELPYTEENEDDSGE